MNTNDLVKRFEKDVKDELAKMFALHNEIAEKYIKDNTHKEPITNGIRIVTPKIDYATLKTIIRKEQNFQPLYEEFWNAVPKINLDKTMDWDKAPFTDILCGYVSMSIFAQSFHNGKIRDVLSFEFLEFLLNKFGYSKEEQATIFIIAMRGSALNTEHKTLIPETIQMFNKDGSFTAKTDTLGLLVNIVTSISDNEVRQIIFRRYYETNKNSPELSESQKAYLKLNYYLGKEILLDLNSLKEKIELKSEFTNIIFLKEILIAKAEKLAAVKKGAISRIDEERQKFHGAKKSLKSKSSGLDGFMEYFRINCRILYGINNCQSNMIVGNFDLFKELFDKYGDFTPEEQIAIILETAKSSMREINLLDRNVFTNVLVLKELENLSKIFNQEGLIIGSDETIRDYFKKIGFANQVIEGIIKTKNMQIDMDDEELRRDLEPTSSIPLTDKSVDYAHIYVSKYYQNGVITAYVDDLDNFQISLAKAGYSPASIDNAVDAALKFNEHYLESLKEQKIAQLKDAYFSEQDQDIYSTGSKLISEKYEDYLGLTDGQQQLVQILISSMREAKEPIAFILQGQIIDIQKAIIIQELKRSLEDIDTVFEMSIEENDEALLQEIPILIDELKSLLEMYIIFSPVQDKLSDNAYSLDYLSTVPNDLPQKMTNIEKKDANILLDKLKQGKGVFDLQTFDGKAFYKFQGGMCVYYAKGKNNSVIVLGLVRCESTGFAPYQRIINRKEACEELARLQNNGEAVIFADGETVENKINQKLNIGLDLK